MAVTYQRVNPRGRNLTGYAFIHEPTMKHVRVHHHMTGDSYCHVVMPGEVTPQGMPVSLLAEPISPSAGAYATSGRDPYLSHYDRYSRTISEYEAQMDRIKAMLPEVPKEKPIEKPKGLDPELYKQEIIRLKQTD